MKDRSLQFIRILIYDNILSLLIPKLNLCVYSVLRLPVAELLLNRLLITLFLVTTVIIATDSYQTDSKNYLEKCIKTS